MPLLPGPLELLVVVLVVLPMDELVLFENYSYSIGPYAKKYSYLIGPCAKIFIFNQTMCKNITYLIDPCAKIIYI